MLDYRMKQNSGQAFNKVFITKYNDRAYRYECDNIKGYKEEVKQNPAMCEIIGEFQQKIKPVFDVDAYDNDIDVNEVKKHINILFPEKSIYFAKREAREHKGKMKYSYRMYVDGVKITSKNLKEYILSHKLNDNPIYDMSIYDKNKILFLPLTNEKTNGEKVPELKPIDFKDIFSCCASYIEENYEDYDLKFIKTEPEVKKEVVSNTEDDCNEFNEEGEDNNKYLKLCKAIEKLKSSRSDAFEKWLNMFWCIINICNKEKIPKTKCCKAIHQFSAKSKEYDEDKVDEWIEKHFDNVKEKGYGWTYLYHTCIKEDDPKYYENLTKSYYCMKKDFEIEHFKIIHPPLILSKKSNGYEIQTFKLFKDSYGHEVYYEKSLVKGTEVYTNKTFVNTWLRDPKIRKYEKIVFKPPPLTTEPNEFNIWVDFKIKNVPLTTTDRDFFKEYCDYAHNLIGDKKVADFILARYASRLKNPAIRTYVCVIYSGDEGDGKNKLLEPIYKIMDNYTQMLSSAKQLYETHSMYEDKKLFILINEAEGVSNFENSDVLKTRITEPNLSVNPKLIQAYNIDNLCDYDMTTNNFNVVKMSDDSNRRFLQIETTSFYRKNTIFFDDFIENIINNPEALRQIYEGLINMDIATIVPSGNFQKDKPTTAIEFEVKKQNRDKIIWFLEDFIREHQYAVENTNKTQFKKKNLELFQDWNKWCEKNKIKSEMNNISFGIKLTQLIKKKLNLNGVVCIKKDASNSTTTIYYNELKTYLEDLNKTSFVLDVDDDEIGGSEV